MLLDTVRLSFGLNLEVLDDLIQTRPVFEVQELDRSLDIRARLLTLAWRPIFIPNDQIELARAVEIHDYASDCSIMHPSTF
jgi:hypothetical protein